MPNDQAIFYSNEKHGKTQPRYLEYTFQITAAKTVVAFPRGAEILPSFDALTQAQIDAYLGTTSEFLVTQFDTTSMGTDAFGGLINMTGGIVSQGASSPSYFQPQGQAASVISCEITSMTGAGLATRVQSASFGPTGLAPTSLTAGCALGANGNIAFRGVLTGLDALTSGLILVRIGWVCA